MAAFVPSVSVATTASLASLPLTGTTYAPLTCVGVQANGGSVWGWYPTGLLPPVGAVTTPGNGGQWVLVTAVAGPLQQVASVQTTDATLTPIWTEPVQAVSTTYDYVVSILGSNQVNGDMFRADYAFNYQRIGSAGPTVAGVGPVALNVRTTGVGGTWGGVTFAVGAVTPNALTVQVQGLAATAINWSFEVMRTEAP
jgi:hypothetical protein